MEDSATGCGKAVQAFFANMRARKTKKTKRAVGAPQVKDRFVAEQSFRPRNTDGKRYRVIEKRLNLPFLGFLKVREGTARLRSLLRGGHDLDAGRKLAGTISFADGYWRVCLDLEVDARAITKRQWPAHDKLVQYPVLGCDLGIKSLVCLATPDGSFVQHSMAPQAVDGARAAIRGHQRRLAIKWRAKAAKQTFRTVGKNEGRAKERLRRRFLRQRNVRNANLHHLTTDLAGRCDVISIENLHIASMLKNHCLALAIAQQAWDEFRRQLTYKTAWAGRALASAEAGSFFFAGLSKSAGNA